MALQHGWKIGSEGEVLRWRPFQLGFILLAADSSCNPESGERLALDLLWFPTGGGKTEAYLALVAMVAFHRRLAGTCFANGILPVWFYHYFPHYPWRGVGKNRWFEH